MGLNTLASAALVALAITITFLLLARIWSLIERVVARRSVFAGHILYEAGHDRRADIARLNASYATGFAALLLFILTLVLAVVLRPSGWLNDFPNWLMVLICVLFAAASAYSLHRFVTLIRRRRLAVFERDASIAVGHSLQRVLGDANRVFHHVGGGSVRSDTIDNVVVGPNGVYAVQIVARRPRRGRGNESFVTIDGNELVFDDAAERVSIAELGPRLKLLARDLGPVAGQTVRVRSVIAIPGWHIREQNSATHLLVNERRIAMIRGWTDSQSFLMNEQVEAISEELAKRCLNSRP